MHDFLAAAWNPNVSCGLAGPLQFATSSPSYTHSRAPAGGVTIQGKFYRGGMWIPKEVLNGASPEEKQQLADAGIVPQGGGGGDSSVNTGSQIPGSAGDDPGGGPMGPPLPPPPPPRTRPRRVSNATASLPPGQAEPASQSVAAAASWLNTASQIVQIDPNDENAWTQLGAGPEMLPGLMLSSLAARGHKAGKFMARGFVQQFGPQFPMIAAQVLPRMPADQLLGVISQHPEIQQKLMRYAQDPRGETLADQRVLWRAVRTAADDSAFGTLAGQAMADAVLMMLQPPQPQENPDLVGRV